MFITFLIDVMKQNQDNDAIIWADTTIKYRRILEKYNFWIDNFKKNKIKKGSVVIVEADFSPSSISLLIALIDCGCIFVPITESVTQKKEEFIRISQGEFLIKFDKNDNANIEILSQKANHKIYNELRKEGHPGLVLFSSGSTGESKASVHDVTGILEKFKTRRHSYRAITFLLYDHIGGFNTLLYILSNAGLIITLKTRKPHEVLKMVEKYEVELLPTSPTFINLIMLSEAYKSYNINSLKIVTYGTEPMPESTLKRFNKLFPKIKLLQTYGLSEVGILRSKSKSSDSLWVKVGGEGFDTRIINGMLEIKAKSAMKGYLNAPSPFTKDGWFKTGDAVEKEDEFIKILGRKSEIINVGGEKVYPQEIENIILQDINIAEVTVYGEKNPIMGNIVCANIRLIKNEEDKVISKRIKSLCKVNLDNYKIPIKIHISKDSHYNERFKKSRRQHIK
jgi:long-chain acyl-CoA synthetase